MRQENCIALVHTTHPEREGEVNMCLQVLLGYNSDEGDVVKARQL
jgi:hypothetical protein